MEIEGILFQGSIGPVLWEDPVKQAQRVIALAILLPSTIQPPKLKAAFQLSRL